MSTAIWICLLGAGSIITACSTMVIIRYLDEKRIGEYQDKILNAQRDEVQNIYRTMRGWRHDYHNHMQTIKAFLALNQIDEIPRYLDQLEADLDSIDIAVQTGNVSIDAILSSKVAMARKKKIDVNVKAKVPDRLTVNEVDLCVIIGNLLDNAMESCERVKEKNKFIRIYIGVWKEQLYISITNATCEVRRKKIYEFISLKGENHGHGLRRIDSITEKYNGFINRRNEPGVFATEVMLPL